MTLGNVTKYIELHLFKWWNTAETVTETVVVNMNEISSIQSGPNNHAIVMMKNGNQFYVLEDKELIIKEIIKANIIVWKMNHEEETEYG